MQDKKFLTLNEFANLLEKSMPNEMNNFNDFLDKQNKSTWLILSDYCIGNKEYPHDTMAYTVASGEIIQYFEYIKSVLSCDLKKVSKKINDNVIKLLSSSNIFTFVFALHNKNRIIRTRELAKKSLEQTIEMIEGWGKNDLNINLIKKLKIVYKNVNSQSFNLKLFNNIVLSAFIAATICTFVSKKGYGKKFCWIGDRDALHQKWDGIVHQFYHLNLHAFIHDQKITPYPEIIGFKDHIIEEEKSILKFDVYTRIPDYFAGTIAKLKLIPGIPERTPYKYKQLLENVIANNKNIIIIKFSFCKDKLFDLVKIEKKHPDIF